MRTGAMGLDGWKSVVFVASSISISVMSSFLASRTLRSWLLHHLQYSEVGSSQNSKGPRDGLHCNQDDITAVGSSLQTRDIDFMSDEIISEQFTRNTQFYGADGQKDVHEALVVIIGLGGVGSHAATMLLRSGVGRLRVIDFDQVSLSSLNRHAVATRADVGMSKALCLQTYFRQIFPECQVDARVQMFNSSSAEEILSGSPDFVLDCIDNIDTKVELLATCVRKGLKVVSATGAGARADPTRIRIADISESSTDPLSRSVRHRLRQEHGIQSGIPVVFSMERPRAKLMPLPSQEKGGSPADFQVVSGNRVRTIPVLGTIPAIFGQVMASYVVTRIAGVVVTNEPVVNLDLEHYSILHHRHLKFHLGFRVRTIPVLGTIPAIFGQVMASYVVTRIAGVVVTNEPVVNLDLEHYSILHHRLMEREELLFGTASGVEVDKEDVAYIVREVWRGRSARRQSSLDVGRGMWHSMKTLTLTRWDQLQPPSIANLVLLTFDEAEEHEQITLEDLKVNDPDYFAMVDSKLRSVRRLFTPLENK